MWRKNHKRKARKWIMAYQKRWKDVGACVRCGEPTSINPKTGKPFQECFKHRLKAAKAVAKYYQKRVKEINNVSNQSNDSGKIKQGFHLPLPKRRPA
jgi:hypothetical protein